MSQSQYDKSRKTVGAIYRDAQQENQGISIETGDMAREMNKSLVDDINEGLSQNPFKDQPFYLMIHEKKDLQMKSTILRRVLFFAKRPWPEDDTLVFWKNPKTGEVRFCWSIPHHSEMFLILANKDQFCDEVIQTVKAWQNFDLKFFGFYEHSKDVWLPNPHHIDESIDKWSFPKTA